TTRTAYQLAHRMNIEMPITEQIYALLYEGCSAQVVLQNLLGRERKSERE
ncbi:MAG: glycerol-3-phosphate dehydrogenase, partial [Myxococcota bacterium]|nr:glycerol-3-phosphate dehydrogenase [Myxococcota bacterium]